MTAVAERRRPLGLLGQRNFRLLWTGETVSTAGNAMATVGVPLLAVTVLHASTFAVAALTAAAYLPWLVIGLPVGAWVDRLPPRPLMVTCDALSALLFASLPVAAWIGILNTPLVVAVALLAGAVNVALSNLAYSGNLALVVVFLVRVVGLGSLAVGLATATGGIGGLVGALISGRLARTFGSARTLILVNLGSGLFSLLIPLTARGPRIACYVIGAAVVSGGIIVSNVIAASFRQEYCPPSMLGRATASMRLAAFGAVPLGALLAGTLGTALGVRNGLWVDLALYAASGSLLLTRSIRTTRDLPSRRSNGACGPQAPIDGVCGPQAPNGHITDSR